MPDKVSCWYTEEQIDKRKVWEWFKVRKYAVNRVRQGESQANAARLAGVRKPTTIGKVERWHRTPEDEILQQLQGDPQLFRRLLPGFMEWYNCGRPHLSLDKRTPLEVFLVDFMNPEEITGLASIHEVA
ncbi:MAG: integrase core domain-containing protein [Methanomassiliicoccales archaeon]|nr:integrase core domain-containing protein [Methanomassiliicoccales archaeon]